MDDETRARIDEMRREWAAITAEIERQWEENLAYWNERVRVSMARMRFAILIYAILTTCAVIGIVSDNAVFIVIEIYLAIVLALLTWAWKRERVAEDARWGLTSR